MKIKAEHRRNIIVVLGIICLCAAWTFAYAFVESDDYNYLKMLRKADSYFAEKNYYWAEHFYKRALELHPDSKRAEDGYFEAFLADTRAYVADKPSQNALDCYRIILDWHPEMDELYIEAADAALICGEPMDAVAFMDMGIAADTNMPETFEAKREYILAHTRIESCTEYRNETKLKSEFYNEAGDPILHIYYNGEQESARTEYTYDEQGRCVKESYFDHATEITILTEYAYDTNGNLLLYKSTRNGEIYDWYENEYDKAGNLIRYVKKYANGSIISTTEFVYDAAGNETEQFCYTSEGTLLESYKTTYMTDGFGGTIQEQLFYNLQQDTQYKYKTWFDAAGNRTKYAGYDEDGIELQYRLITYDEHGNQVKYEEYFDSVCVSDCEYTYDADGLLLTTSRYSNKESIRKLASQTTYLYDAAGNLLCETQTDDSDAKTKRETVTQREYQYVYEE